MSVVEINRSLIVCTRHLLEAAKCLTDSLEEANRSITFVIDHLHGHHSALLPVAKCTMCMHDQLTRKNQFDPLGPDIASQL